MTELSLDYSFYIVQKNIELTSNLMIIDDVKVHKLANLNAFEIVNLTYKKTLPEFFKILGILIIIALYIYKRDIEGVVFFILIPCTLAGIKLLQQHIATSVVNLYELRVQIDSEVAIIRSSDMCFLKNTWETLFKAINDEEFRPITIDVK